MGWRRKRKRVGGGRGGEFIDNEMEEVEQEEEEFI